MIKKFPWEEKIRKILEQKISSSDKSHGISHLLKVKARVKELLIEPEYENANIDIEALIAASYLHDVGFHYRGKIGSIDAYEHIEFGVEAAKEILIQLDFPQDKFKLVEYLIYNHDNIKWGLKNAFLKDQAARLTKEQIKQREETINSNLKLALRVLKEADSFEGTDIHGIERTLYYCKTKGIPILPNPSYQDPLNANTLSNFLIFPHIAWLNAYTKSGKHLAARGYTAAEKWVRDYCTEHNISYRKENHPALSFDLSTK